MQARHEMGTPDLRLSQPNDCPSHATKSVVTEMIPRVACCMPVGSISLQNHSLRWQGEVNRPSADAMLLNEWLTEAAQGQAYDSLKGGLAPEPSIAADAAEPTPAPSCYRSSAMVASDASRWMRRRFAVGFPGCEPARIRAVLPLLLPFTRESFSTCRAGRVRGRCSATGKAAYRVTLRGCGGSGKDPLAHRACFLHSVRCSHREIAGPTTPLATLADVPMGQEEMSSTLVTGQSVRMLARGGMVADRRAIVRSRELAIPREGPSTASTSEREGHAI